MVNEIDGIDTFGQFHAQQIAVTGEATVDHGHMNAATGASLPTPVCHVECAQRFAAYHAAGFVCCHQRHGVAHVVDQGVLGQIGQ